MAKRSQARDDVPAIDELPGMYERIRTELAKVIVGQEEVIEQLLIVLFARGHCLLVGVPGLAKTLLVRTLAEVLIAGVQPHPVHARPDAVGHHGHGHHRRRTGQPGAREFRFMHGPMFANIVLADEINRTPPKTQAALLEAMQEHQVTAGGQTHQLPSAVLRAGHAEPDRAGGHVSAARGAARPLHVQHQRRLSDGRRGAGDLEDDDGRGARWTDLTGERIAELQRLVRRVPVSDHIYEVRGAAGAAVAADVAGRAGMGEELDNLGRGSACGAVPDSGREGARGAVRQLPRADG